MSGGRDNADLLSPSDVAEENWGEAEVLLLGKVGSMDDLDEVGAADEIVAGIRVDRLGLSRGLL